METETFKYELSSFFPLLCGVGHYDPNLFHHFTAVVASAALSSVQISQGGGKTIIHAQQ
jgi:hypothetical protein